LSKAPSDAVNIGIGLIPEDRKEQGLILGMNIKDNITLGVLKSLAKFGIVNRKKQDTIFDSFSQKLSIKAYSSMQLVSKLSGGNQQKVVIAKWLAANPKILILDEPTRGIDVGAKAEIYALIDQLANQGIAIILISSELPEILGMSDRIIVLREGKQVSEFSRSEATEEIIMQSFIGGV